MRKDDFMRSEGTARRARRNCLELVYAAHASHIGSALSIIDIVAVLYDEILNVFPDNPENADRDRFILSKGHAAIAVYSVLAEKGFFGKEILYRQLIRNLKTLALAPVEI